MRELGATGRLTALEEIEEIVRNVPIDERLRFIDEIRERIPLMRIDTARQAVELAGGEGSYGAISRAAELANTSRPTLDSLLRSKQR